MNIDSPFYSFEAQFTETMRMMLQGTKPNAEECHCPRCNRKRWVLMVCAPSSSGKGEITQSFVPISVDFISLVESVYLYTGVPVMNAQ